MTDERAMYVRGVGNLFINYNNIQLFRNEITASRAYDRNYSVGRQDRLEGKPCASANGAYLDGWYGVKS